MDFFNILNDLNIALDYYLFKLFGAVAAAFIAWEQWRRYTAFPSLRLTYAFGALAVLQILFFVLLAATEVNLALPIERVMGVVSSGILIWGFTPYFRTHEFRGNSILAINSAAATVTLLLVIVLWDGDNFNQTRGDILLTVWQVGLLGFGLGNCLQKADNERWFAIYSFFALLSGQLSHISLAQYYPDPNIPLLIWLSEVVAYVILVIAVYQGAMHSIAKRTSELEWRRQVSLNQLKGLGDLFKATQKITASLKRSEVLANATQNIANATEADQCAIALPTDEGDLSHLRLVEIYNVAREGRGEAVSFPVRDQREIQAAIENKTSIQVDQYKDNPQLDFLFTIMGAAEPGPLMVQPLLQQGEPIGVLLLGNSVSKRVFTETERDFILSLAEQVAIAIKHAAMHDAAEHEVRQLRYTLRNQEAEAGKMKAAMESQLRKSREEVDLFAKRLYEYEVKYKDKERALSQTESQLQQIQTQLTRLTPELDSYRQQLAAAESENKQLKGIISRLEQAVGEMETLREAASAPVVTRSENGAEMLFIAALAQNVRTPMTSVAGYTDLLLGESVGGISPMQRKFLQRIKANVNRLGAMLDDLITVTAIDTGQLVLTPVAVDLAELIENILITLNPQIEAKELTIKRNFLEAMPFVHLDARTSQQILHNLLNNAIQATPDNGSVTLTTTVESESDKPYLHLAVQDGGGGVASEELPDVFDRFYEADKPLIQGLGDTGVSLSIVKALVEINNGRIWVESDIGVGTTFTLVLPVSEQGDDPWENFLDTLPPFDLNPT